MTTIRQIERLWTAKTYDKLFRELLAYRPEASFRIETETGRAPIVAALAMIRLEELSQSHVPLYGTMLRAVLSAQQPDGGWGDVIATALCGRALLCGKGNGLAVDRGLLYLVNMQKPEGIWPAIPLRRMPADPYTSAFILYQLGESARFRSAVRFPEAIRWFDVNLEALDADTLALWDRASLRCRLRPTMPEPAAELASLGGSFMWQ